MQEAFEYLMKGLSTPPEFAPSFVMETYASSAALDLVLSQKKEDEKLHSVQFETRTMTEHERR